jgi:hypothetical protein
MGDHGFPGGREACRSEPGGQSLVMVKAWLWSSLVKAWLWTSRQAWWSKPGGQSPAVRTWLWSNPGPLEQPGNPGGQSLAVKARRSKPGYGQIQAPRDHYSGRPGGRSLPQPGGQMGSLARWRPDHQAGTRLVARTQGPHTCPAFLVLEYRLGKRQDILRRG